MEVRTDGPAIPDRANLRQMYVLVSDAQNEVVQQPREAAARWKVFRVEPDERLFPTGKLQDQPIRRSVFSVGDDEDCRVQALLG